MRSKNIESNTNCILRNKCPRPNLCCSFCDEESCDIRCKDNPSKCQYITNDDEWRTKVVDESPISRMTKSGYLIPLSMDSLYRDTPPSKHANDISMIPAAPIVKRARAAKKKRGG